jgi:FKBP-type peptidyl-prolyl cis-trans isomerase SlpA
MVKSVTKKVAADDILLVHMTLAFADGAIADSTRASGEPVLLKLGDGSISEAFEAKLIGSEQGAKLNFDLQPEDAFGASDADQVQFFERYQFTEQDLEEDTIMLFEKPDGSQLPGVIKAIEGSSVKVDFNHPLAGEVVNFDIEVIDINPVTPEQQQIQVKSLT